MQDLGTIGNKKEEGIHVNFVVARGESFIAELDMDEDENDFSSWSLKMTVERRSDKEVILTLSSSPRFVFNASTGTLTISLGPEETNLFLERVAYDYDIRVRILGANPSILFWGKITSENWITSGD